MKTLRIPSRLKTWTFRIGLSVVLVGASVVAYAGGVPVVWTSGETLTAADLNTNFTALTPYLAFYQGAGCGMNTTIGTTVTLLDFPTVVTDDTGGAVTFPGGAWTFTAPVAGTYRVKASAWINNATTSNVTMFVYTNAQEDGPTAQRTTLGASDTMEVSGYVTLKLNDKVTVAILSGTANSVQGCGQRTWVSVEGPIPTR